MRDQRPPMSERPFASMEAALGASASVADHRVVDLAASQPPWVDSGLVVGAGDQVTVIRHGRVVLAEPDLWLDAGFNIWIRIGGRGPITRGSRATHTLTAPHDGNVQLGNATPAEWADTNGAITIDPGAYALVTGKATVAVIRWSPGTDPAQALRHLADGGDETGYLAAEADRLDHDPAVTPPGWEHLWLLGPSEIYTDTGETIDCTTGGNVGILCHDVDLAFSPATTVSWSWKVDQLPSTEAEDSFSTHDYLSVAVEFDDGTDLSWYWSATLSNGTHYRCPLPHWNERETHLVVRTGDAELGRWVNETRDVLADHRYAVGGPPPHRIMRLWLIATSVLQRQPGHCQYRNLVVRTREGAVVIKPGAMT